jgi:hypothetical protein
MKLLWLDDARNPHEDDWLVMAPIPRDQISEVIWVKSYQEFVDWIIHNGLPDGICFDHDLADEHYNPAMYSGVEAYNEVAKNFKEKTGMDCAKWLVEYCMDYNKKLPFFKSQSANPAGRENILGYLENYKKMSG